MLAAIRNVTLWSLGFVVLVAVLVALLLMSDIVADVVLRGG
jgi:hypothetical protein